MWNENSKKNYLFRLNIGGFHGNCRCRSRGHEVARLVPPEKKMVKSRKMLEKLRKTAYVGDVVSPHSEDWKVLK